MSRTSSIRDESMAIGKAFPGLYLNGAEELLKAILINLFKALEYLHSEVNVIHTGTNCYSMISNAACIIAV